MYLVFVLKYDVVVIHRLSGTCQAFDVAKKQGYVVLRGTGYRRERKGSPLLNIFRQFCDAKAVACISVCTVRYNQGGQNIQCNTMSQKEDLYDLLLYFEVLWYYSIN